MALLDGAGLATTATQAAEACRRPARRCIRSRLTPTRPTSRWRAHAVEARDLDEAAKRLRAVADSSRDAQLRLVARSRLARVLAEQGKHDDALALLDVADAGAFAALCHEIRGDMFAAKGDAAAARARIRRGARGATARSSRASIARYVELKRDALAVPRQPRRTIGQAAAHGACPSTAPVTPQS